MHRRRRESRNSSILADAEDCGGNGCRRKTRFLFGTRERKWRGVFLAKISDVNVFEERVKYDDGTGVERKHTECRSVFYSPPGSDPFLQCLGTFLIPVEVYFCTDTLAHNMSFVVGQYAVLNSAICRFEFL